VRLLEFTKKNNVCQEKNKKKRLTRFYFLCNIPPKSCFGVVSSSSLIGKGLGGQCKFTDFFEFRIFLVALILFKEDRLLWSDAICKY